MSPFLASSNHGVLVREAIKLGPFNPPENCIFLNGGLRQSELGRQIRSHLCRVKRLVSKQVHTPKGRNRRLA